jgi:hexosaminidase
LKTDLPPLLVPTPRRLVLNGGRVSADADCAAEAVDPAADVGWTGDEAFRLRISRTVQAPVVIEARSEAGVRHARATLAQLTRQYGEVLPCMVVEDGPAIAKRGYMLDVSRDRVPRMEHLLEIVNLLASLKYNHFQLYTEHTFAFAGHEEVWRDASPMTPAEVRELDVHCRRQGIELAANQNCFGHLAAWLRLPRYAGLAETHSAWSFEMQGPGGTVQRVERTGPFSLCPVDPASLDLIEDLLSQLLPCFSSRLVNIGCDETFDVGAGRSAEAVAERGGGSRARARVYLEFVARVADVVRRQGKVPMFWADILLSHPDLAEAIAPDLVRLAWGYEGDAAWDRWLSTLGPRQTWVCPGTSSWRSITGRAAERRANIAGAARAAAAQSAAGLLLTDWGDGGHRQQWPISLPGIAHAAEAAWSGSGDEPDPRALSLHVLNDESLRAGPWLNALGDVDLSLRKISGRRQEGEEPRSLRNASALYADLHLTLWPSADDDPALRRGVLSSSGAEWEEALGRIETLTACVPRGLPALLERELRHTLRVAKAAAERGRARRRSGGMTAAAAGRLRDELREIIEEHRALWRERSRDGGLASSCMHYARVIEDLVP